MLEAYVACADYTPSSSNKENIPLVEGQEVEVLDCKSTSRWLVRTQDKTTKEIKQGWVPASHLSAVAQRGRSNTGTFNRGSIKVNASELELVDDTLSRKEKEARIKRG